ncbi:endonuclease I family protein [Virgibacillus necropolis]|uniref:Endonuclease I n=1 Tax=Virgibacillus necropolis TaxID=163877 RepID=A0A221MHC1_9BACI|nr:endonuclease [Virgibacillus necropolis]ASN07034.1 endonuclease I [Virgibacillus necropolis]
MNLTHQQKERLFPVTKDPQRISTVISQLTKTKESIQKDAKVYYDEEKDKRTIQQYYRNIDFINQNDDEFIRSLTQILEETHKNKVRYDPSEYVYPWVDLRPDGNLISIYSGKKRQAEEVIKEDYETSLRREKEAEKELDAKNGRVMDQLAQIESNFKYNCEHSVPQSWFNEQEPMRGDLHHLFTCEPVCNSIRSNYPYHDFTDYTPEGIKANRIEEACGKADENLFEPEYGKGTVARAMLYFLIRYPDRIEQSHMEGVDTGLLLEWHQNSPPDLYEKHRNQAIYEIQGNRNPFIDFPEKMNRPILADRKV